MTTSKLARLFFYDDESPRPMLLLWLKVVLFWTPLGTGALVLLLGGTRQFGGRFLFSALVGIVTATVAIWGSALTERGELALYRRRGLDRPRHGHLWSFLLGVFFMLPGLYLGFVTARLVGEAGGHHVFMPALRDYRNGLLFGVIISGFFFLLQTQRDARLARERAERSLAHAERQRLEAQVAALTAQMNPHFLFNALNSIAALIPSEPEQAEEVTVGLSELYRAVLRATRRETQSLAEELDICRRYLTLEEVRFGDRLSHRVEVAAEVDAEGLELPSLTLQPLVENAVKYGVAPRTEPGRVVITARPARDAEGRDAAVIVEVVDDGPGPNAKPPRPGSGTSLQNCTSRLALRYGAEASLRHERTAEGGTRITLRIPTTALRPEETSATPQTPPPAGGQPQEAP